MPLIMTHGWPGSFVEMLKIIPLLTDPAAHGYDAVDSFDVVVPSLPGFGFSDRPGHPEMILAPA
jgi:pimeloyl-ACP methyl ester carboxylesterase